jgi:RNA polymerase sigma factor (sigma-70 family)
MSELSAEQLLAQRAWLRRLAVAIVGESQADDIVQQTVTAALASPPRDAARLRGWLARVARHLAWKHTQRERRRTEREAEAARQEALPPPEELLARIEEESVVARTVTGLDEPYRSTLLWRYYEDLPVAEIARRTGELESTIRTRTQRGLERLRERLEARLGSEWRLAVLPLLAPGPGAAPAAGAGLLHHIGGLLVTTNGKLCVVGVVLLAAFVASTFLDFGGQRPEEHLTVRVSAAEPATGSPADSPAEPTSVARTAVDSVELAPTVLERATTVRRSGVVLDTTGLPLAGVPVLAQPTDGSDDVALGDTDDGGAFLLELTDAAVGEYVLKCGEGYFTLYSAVVRAGPADDGELFVVAAPDVLLRGQVVRSDGPPLAGVQVGFDWWSLASFPRELGSVRKTELPQVVTGEDGSFEFPSSPGTEQLELHFRRDGFAEEALGCSSRDRTNLLVTMEPHHQGMESFRAVVLDESGAAIRGALVSHGGVEETSDALGEVQLPWMRRSGWLIAVALGKEPLIREGFGHEAWTADGSPDPVELVLTEARLRIAGRVFDREGRAAADVPVTVERGTPLAGGRFAELVSSGGDPARTLELTRTDVDGRFELRGLADKDYVVSAYDPRTYECVRETVAAGSEGVGLRFDPAGVLQDVEAVCVDGDGAPLAGVEIGLLLQVTYGRDGQLRRPALAITDEEGRFELEALPVGNTLVSFEGAEILDAFRFVTSEAAADPGPLRFELPRASSVRFVPSGEDPEGCRAGLMREDGTIVSLWVQAENDRMFDLTWEVSDGVSPIYKVDAGEYTLFVARGAEFLREETLRIHEGELNELLVP